MEQFDEPCPYLRHVTVDMLWQFRNGAYCRRPDSTVRSPTLRTLATVCATEQHRDCEGFKAYATREPAA